MWVVRYRTAAELQILLRVAVHRSHRSADRRRERTVSERLKGRSGRTDGQLAVNTRVRHRFADPARRWAVLLDTGNLVFTNTDQLVPE